MISINKALLIGKIEDGPQKIEYPTGFGARFTIRTTETLPTKEGGTFEKNEWTEVTCWGKNAEYVIHHVNKYDWALVEGRLETRKFEDKEGKTRYKTQVNAQKVQKTGDLTQTGLDSNQEANDLGF